MKKVHLVICDLFLPAGACAGLRLPALEKMLARSTSELMDTSGATLESHLCGLFGVTCGQVAPISAAFDGLGKGYWLRADPVHLRLQRDQMILLPNMAVGAGEAQQICATLNEYFAGQGMEFFVPQPHRWYVRVDRIPEIETSPLSQVSGRNVRDLLPKGLDAARWHRVLNETQMLLFSHPVNTAREARGELPVNSLWFWGGGESPAIQKTYDEVSSSEILAEMFAARTGVPFEAWQESWVGSTVDNQLLVWTGLTQAFNSGDLEAWRLALQRFEAAYAKPLWQALCAGKISQIQLDIPGGNRAMCLMRADTLAFWRRKKSFI